VSLENAVAIAGQFRMMNGQTRFGVNTIRVPSVGRGRLMGISFEEFVERLNEHADGLSQGKKNAKDVARAIINIVAFGVFKNTLG
jgi:hypothetical protein